MATAIPDPDAFAAALANGVRHPNVTAILDRPREPHEKSLFGRTPDYQHWEIKSMYPTPRKGDENQP